MLYQNTFVHIALGAETCLETLTSCRWIVCYMTSFGFLLSNAMRNCLTITMVCMIKEVNSTAILNESASQQGSCYTTVNSTSPYAVC